MVKQLINGFWIVIVGLLGSAVIAMISGTPRGTAVVLRPIPTPEPVIIHVVGAVLHPGVYTLASGSRVRDALDAAGGLRLDAKIESLNLAARLQDGAQISVPALQPTEILRVGSLEETATIEPVTGVEVNKKININHAAKEELTTLSGIGPVTAEKIILFRTENGPFNVIDDIMNVPGIGPAKFDAIKNFITVKD